MMSMQPTRRGFLCSGLCLVFNSSCRLAGAQATTFEPNAYIRIASDNTITLSMTCSEMGQGMSVPPIAARNSAGYCIPSLGDV